MEKILDLRQSPLKVTFNRDCSRFTVDVYSDEYAASGLMGAALALANEGALDGLGVGTKIEVLCLALFEVLSTANTIPGHPYRWKRD